MYPWQSPGLVVLGLALLHGGCAGDGSTPMDPGQAGIEAIQRDDTWVFTYSRTPDTVMEALHSGPAAIVDGCLQVDDAIVIWYDHHLSAVDDIIARIHLGQTVSVTLGGGGDSLDEGSTIDDFPDAVLAHCSPSVIWYSGDGDITIIEDF